MILVLGGTTEGRAAVQVLEEAGKPFYYSTKGEGQQVILHHGIRLSGGMDPGEMASFCKGNGIRLMVDAAHPFAEQLHQTVRQVADTEGIPVVRYERIYPHLPGELPIIWCKDYPEAIHLLQNSGISVLLALTGVQTIGRLKPLWQSGIRCYFRILRRDSSRILAEQQGFPAGQLCYYNDNENDMELMRRLSPDAILMKENGLSGGFLPKAEAAASLGIRVFAIRRPPVPDTFKVVDGPHGLRRMVEKLLPDFYDLHSGITTGTCATAAAVAAIFSLYGHSPEEVPVRLPGGETIPVPVSAKKGEGCATVIKDAGDDPDITNGTGICASVDFREGESRQIVLRGGEGVGIVTLPGLGIPVGAPAINKVPSQMIRDNVNRALDALQAPAGVYTVVISVPDGKRLAERTFNPRLGVLGGISIIGTSGIVKPFSSDAFVQSIRKSMEVARAAGGRCVVINSGAKSERILRSRFPELPPQAFVHYGNFIGETLRIADSLKIPRLVMGLMIGKAVKLAEGHMDTHSKHTVMNKDFLRRAAAGAGCPEHDISAIGGITLARELWDKLTPAGAVAFASHILELCRQNCSPLFPNGELRILLISETGEIYG